MRAIACLQERSPCTISRELRRNSSDEGDASAPAQHPCQQRRFDVRPPPKRHPEPPRFCEGRLVEGCPCFAPHPRITCSRCESQWRRPSWCRQ
ncbi:hypothetical protein [Brachymonas sp.]|uniref:hypothetical protein n=1 Tax=Brachymonas sp. TaxID=1936292 RepID=UPI0035B339FA